MKCKNCGNEIPDDAKFCGFCGTPVEEDNTADKTAAPAEETAAPASSETNAPESETVPPTVGSQIEDSLKNTAAGKAVLGEDGKLNKEDFARMGNAAKEGAKNAYQSVPWEEFKTFLDIFKDPFGDHALTIVPACVTAVVTILVNWLAVGNFLNGLIIAAIAYAGFFLVLYVNKTEEHFDFKTAFGRASQLMTLPVIAMFVMCLFGMSMKSSLNNTSAAMTNMSTYLYTLRSSVVIVLIFLLFAMVMYTMGMIVAGKKMNKYLLAVIITAVFGFSLFYLISQMLSSLIAGL